MSGMVPRHVKSVTGKKCKYIANATNVKKYFAHAAFIILTYSTYPNWKFPKLITLFLCFRRKFQNLAGIKRPNFDIWRVTRK